MIINKKFIFGVIVMFSSVSVAQDPKSPTEWKKPDKEEPLKTEDVVIATEEPELDSDFGYFGWREPK